MSRIAIAALVLLLAVPCAQAKLPPAPPKSPAEQAAAAEKAKEAAAKDAAELAAAMDRAVANYRKNKGLPPEQPAAPAKAANGQKKHK
ncbi:MAG: formate dehydrogenase [Betaproteobacteria bacterium]|nr:formate dehydrogenase [Betaproteobacteria bacterium]